MTCSVVALPVFPAPTHKNKSHTSEDNMGCPSRVVSQRDVNGDELVRFDGECASGFVKIHV